jgi:hypothetical protein
MGDCQKRDLRLDFERCLRLKFLGSKVTSDPWLRAFRELDERLGLTAGARDLLQVSRLGKNKRHGLLPQHGVEGAGSVVCGRFALACLPIASQSS